MERLVDVGCITKADLVSRLLLWLDLTKHGRDGMGLVAR